MKRYFDEENLRYHIIRENRNPLKVMLTSQEKAKFLELLEEVGAEDPISVRCGECKYFETVWCPLGWIPEEDWFCANGRRRENGRK